MLNSYAMNCYAFKNNLQVSNTGTEVHTSVVRHYRSLGVIIEVSNTETEVHPSVRHY